eukprot:TRINITY_DN42324_c0_g1_i1.p1 TRINITY_DN42324_c0_g1~~TRINITY_DN42324_c0_g1_i1.p1  ORF type:complete len:463 (-),score=65.74 TRINITY_DN42324_c0_g1_i1:398-1786(-)
MPCPSPRPPSQQSGPCVVEISSGSDDGEECVKGSARKDRGNSTKGTAKPLRRVKRQLKKKKKIRRAIAEPELSRPPRLAVILRSNKSADADESGAKHVIAPGQKPIGKAVRLTHAKQVIALGEKPIGKAVRLTPAVCIGVGTYLPPGRRQQLQEQAEWEQVKLNWRQKVLSEESCSGSSRSTRPACGPNMRVLARKCENVLEKPGSCGFNRLQADLVEVSEDGLSAECCSATAGGLKGLPLLVGGRYQYEVELLKPCALVIGWSAATSLPGCFDNLSFGYRSDGWLVHNHSEYSDAAYGPAFGHAGDVIGTWIDWQERGVRIYFAVNGRRLGVAFNFREPSCRQGFPPLQLHLCQGAGPAFQVRVRGLSASLPLYWPFQGFRPLGDHVVENFCPFSSAVEQASALNLSRPPTLARRLIHGSLGLQMPLSHVAQERQLEGQIAGKSEKSDPGYNSSPPKLGGA